MSLTFKLRDGLTWHDGDDFTVEDVAWSIRTAIKAPRIHSVVVNTVNSIKGAEAFKQIHDGTCSAPKIVLLP